MHQQGANWHIPEPTYPKTMGCKSTTTDLSTSYTVVERPDHHCGDDLVPFVSTYFCWRSPGMKGGGADLLSILVNNFEAFQGFD